MSAGHRTSKNGGGQMKQLTLWKGILKEKDEITTFIGFIVGNCAWNNLVQDMMWILKLNLKHTYPREYVIAHDSMAIVANYHTELRVHRGKLAWEDLFKKGMERSGGVDINQHFLCGREWWQRKYIFNELPLYRSTGTEKRRQGKRDMNEQIPNKVTIFRCWIERVQFFRRKIT